MAYSLKAGEECEVWSSSEKKWVAAMIDEVLAEARMERGHALPQGAVKVVSAVGTKYLYPNQVEKALRRLTDSSKAISATMRFSKGDEVEIWSNSKGMWLEGVVDEVNETACVKSGFQVPVGCLKVTSAVGHKYVPAEKADGMLRPRNEGMGGA